MVKGTSRRVIVVDSPDPKLFEQAIFIVKNDAFSQEGVTSQQVLGEACRIAQGYAARQGAALPPWWSRVPWWTWLVAGTAAAGIVGILAFLLR
ncbi:MAG: translation initiation factor 2 [Oscillospiraceae bacterium]|nr:translation initiation factor 2 [Oscillospiraceae bacterium]